MPDDRERAKLLRPEQHEEVARALAPAIDTLVQVGKSSHLSRCFSRSF
jgi:hypothetical protein